jgi:hypothetical protein
MIPVRQAEEMKCQVLVAVEPKKPIQGRVVGLNRRCGVRPALLLISAAPARH